ncbi:MAG TPA: S8 family serine peptidase, partial [Cyclobacteriaceae bacterium]
YEASNGEVITVTSTSETTCTIITTINVTVNKRQQFGVCAPFAGKVNDPIGSELTMLYNIIQQGGQVSTNEVFYISGESVLVEIVFFADLSSAEIAQLQSILNNLGFESDDNISDVAGSLIITGFLPFDSIDDLNAVTDYINYVRPATPPLRNLGSATTQGDRVMRSNLARLGYGISGEGVKIGVLSDSYNTVGTNPAALDVANADLPGAANTNGYNTPVTVTKDFPSRYGQGTDEGRAMLQIIHDIAPGAELVFRTGFITAGDFARGIRDLKQNENCDIIVDDITYITEPFYTNGKVAQAVNDVAAQGVSYFTAAGNFGSRSYESVFSPVGAPANLAGQKLHDFGGGDTRQSITVGPGNYTIVLQWDDPVYSIGSLGEPLAGTVNDLDIYLTNFQNAELFGFNRNNIGGDPIEVLSFSVPANTTLNTDIIIAHAAGSGENFKFKYVIFRGDNMVVNEHFTGASTIVGQANAAGAMTVGALLYSNTSTYGFSPVPAGTAPFTVATFSSRGGTETAGQVMAKPDFTAPNGVNTTVFLGGADLEGDDKPNFYGTSAAAPHAAAVAALIMEAKEKYYPESAPLHTDGSSWNTSSPGSSPSDIRKVLQSTAQDMHETGFDNNSGSGLVRSDAALLTLATPKPVVTRLVIPDDVNAGTEVFTLVIEGTNFYYDSKVLLRGEEIESTYNAETDNLEAIIQPFEGNPPIQVGNTPMTNLGDGGTTEPLPLLNIPKVTVAIRANDISKKFGQLVPDFDATVLALANDATGNLVWQDTGLTLENVGLTLDESNTSLTALQFTSTINDFGSNLASVGSYVIIPSHAETDIVYRELYNYAGVVQPDGSILYDGQYAGEEPYGPGTITVEKLPIKIKPNDLTIEYGQSISDEISYAITVDEAAANSITDLEGLVSSISNEYQLDLAKAKQVGDNT